MGTKWKNPLVWLRGFIASFITGGAGGVSAAVVAMGLTPGQYNFQEGFKNVIAMFIGVFVVSGFIGGCAYLQKSPLPELEEEQTTITVKEQVTITSETKANT